LGGQGFLLAQYYKGRIAAMRPDCGKAAPRAASLHQARRETLKTRRERVS